MPLFGKVKEASGSAHYENESTRRISAQHVTDKYDMKDLLGT